MSFSAAAQHEILAALHRLSVEREKTEKQIAPISTLRLHASRAN